MAVVPCTVMLVAVELVTTHLFTTRTEVLVPFHGRSYAKLATLSCLRHTHSPRHQDQPNGKLATTVCFYGDLALSWVTYPSFILLINVDLWPISPLLESHYFLHPGPVYQEKCHWLIKHEIFNVLPLTRPTWRKISPTSGWVKGAKFPWMSNSFLLRHWIWRKTNILFFCTSVTE